MEIEPVVIYGAGGLGSLVLDILEQAGRYRPVAFLDSNPARHGQVIMGLPVRGGLAQLDTLRAEGVTRAIVAIGDNAARVELAETLAARGFTLVAAIHPLATISPSAEIGAHVVIGPRATVCVHARIAPHCVLLAGAIAEHDNVLGPGVFLHPAVRLAGGVHIAELALLGIGATVIPGRRVGRAAFVHPGAVVIHDVAAESAVAGIPALPVDREGSRFVAEPRPQCV
jgi:sugar O-acyltransferase (sialic acid O-acetyltransferase NeuD family)